MSESQPLANQVGIIQAYPGTRVVSSALELQFRSVSVTQSLHASPRNKFQLVSPALTRPRQLAVTPAVHGVGLVVHRGAVRVEDAGLQVAEEAVPVASGPELAGDETVLAGGDVLYEADEAALADAVGVAHLAVLREAGRLAFQGI